MRYLIMVRANAQSEAGVPPEDTLFAKMAAYHEELARSGVLLDAGGLRPSRDGFRVRYRAGKPSLVDGPFAETKELIAGYTLIQVRSADEAREWARRFPAPFGEQTDCEVEVRRLYECEDFAPSAAAERFRGLHAARG